MADSITSGGIYFPAPYIGLSQQSGPPSFGTMTLTVSNAVAFSGRIFLADRSASKILSSAGGAVSFRTGNTSVWTALSSLSMGIQDIDAANGPPVRPDMVFDVSRTITSSTVTLTSNFWHTFTMSTGTKTLSHGEMYAFVVRMANRVSTDAASIAAYNTTTQTTANLNVSTLSAGTAWTATQAVPNVLFQCDDGTLAWFAGGTTISSLSSVSVSSLGTNSEVGLAFHLPWTSQVDELGVAVQVATSAADYTVRLYSNPKGTPVTITAIPMFAEYHPITATNPAYIRIPLAAPVTLTASTTYMLAVGASTATAITVRYLQFASAANRVALPCGSFLQSGARGGGAGAFSLVNTNIPAFWNVRINQIAAGAATTVTTTTTITITVGGGAGGILVHPGMSGGVRG